MLVEASGGNPDLARAPLVVASASTYWRNAWKYQARAYRHCFWDAGMLHANLLAVAETQGLEPRVIMGFADRPVEALLGLDPMREGALTLVALGRSDHAPPPAPALSELRLETEPLSGSEVDYPAIRAMHEASSLGDAAEARSWGPARAAVGAKVARTGAHGVVHGTGDAVLELAYVTSLADIQVGDLVVTSGDDSIYPPGLEIGRIRRVVEGAPVPGLPRLPTLARPEAALFLDIELAPLVEVLRVDHLLLLAPGARSDSE